MAKAQLEVGRRQSVALAFLAMLGALVCLLAASESSASRAWLALGFLLLLSSVSDLLRARRLVRAEHEREQEAEGGGGVRRL